MLLSQAIRKGIPITPEDRNYCGCALGAAMAGVIGHYIDYGERLPIFGTEIIAEEEIANKFGWDTKLCIRISCAHDAGEMTREQCADYAEKWEREHGLWPEWTLENTRAWLDMQYKQLPREVA